MRRIQKITIKNFNAFQSAETIYLEGKNALFYGNNGSGKSSIFWALYTFLQSSTKLNEEIEKYFKPFDALDTKTHQSLKNIFCADQALADVLQGLESGITGDFIAQDIRRSLNYLGEISGEIGVEDLLGEIFGNFCIGK